MALESLKFPIRTEAYNSLKALNLAASFEGISNVFDLVEKYSKVKFVVERTAARENCSKNRAEDSLDTIKMDLPANVWGAIVDYLVSVFDSSADAQRVFEFFVPAVYLDYSAFSLVSEYVDTVKGGVSEGINFLPNFTKNFTEVAGAGIEDGFYGYKGTRGLSIRRSTATNIKMSLADSWSSVQLEFTAFTEAFVSADKFSATVSDGVYSASFTSAAGSYKTMFLKLNSAVFKTTSDCAGLLVNLDVAKFASSNIFTVGAIA